MKTDQFIAFGMHQDLVFIVLLSVQNIVFLHFPDTELESLLVLQVVRYQVLLTE